MSYMPKTYLTGQSIENGIFISLNQNRTGLLLSPHHTIHIIFKISNNTAEGNQNT